MFASIYYPYLTLIDSYMHMHFLNRIHICALHASADSNGQPFRVMGRPNQDSGPLTLARASGLSQILLF